MQEQTIANAASATLNPIAERAADQADRAIDATQRAANGALDTLHGKVASLRTTVPELVDKAAHTLGDLTQKGMDRARETSAIVRERAHEASESTRGYIRDEPIKSVLVAAAAGAALATVLTVMARSRAARQG